MAYADRDALEKRYGSEEIEQRESALEAGAVQQALVDADALIDGYLAGRYTLPLSVIPPNLPQVACAIARYSLIGDAATERARNDYKDAMAWLKDVEAGRVRLQSAAPVPGNEPAAVVMVAPGQAVFKRSGRP
jgi:phage gp36-like protein